MTTISSLLDAMRNMGTVSNSPWLDGDLGDCIGYITPDNNNRQRLMRIKKTIRADPNVAQFHDLYGVSILLDYLQYREERNQKVEPFRMPVFIMIYCHLRGLLDNGEVLTVALFNKVERIALSNFVAHKRKTRD